MGAECHANNRKGMLTLRYGPILFYLSEFEQNVRNHAVYGIQDNQQETKRREMFT